MLTDTALRNLKPQASSLKPQAPSPKPQADCRDALTIAHHIVKAGNQCL